MEPVQILAFILHFLCVATVSTMTQPQFIVSPTVLPIQGALLSVVFDDNDSIYLLGGSGDPGTPHPWKALYKYSILTNKIEKLGEWKNVRTPRGGGGVLDASTGRILHVGGVSGYGGHSPIDSINLADPVEWKIIGHLPFHVASHGIAWDPIQAKAYLFGGYQIDREAGDVPGTLGDRIMMCNTRENTTSTVAHLPKPVEFPNVVYDALSSTAYVIGGGNATEISPGTTFTDIIQVKFKPDVSVKLLNVSLPKPTYRSCSVWVGKHIYIIGGYWEIFGATWRDTKRYYNGVVRFTPGSCQDGAGGGTVEELMVDNFPAALSGQSCVYVDKLNRIYMFGGLEAPYNAGITYIDLHVTDSKQPERIGPGSPDAEDGEGCRIGLGAAAVASASTVTEMISSVMAVTLTAFMLVLIGR